MIADQHMEETGQTIVMNLADYFSDPDDDALNYAATSGDASVTAAVSLTGRDSRSPVPRRVRPK